MSLASYRLRGQPQQKIRPEHLDRAAIVYQSASRAGSRCLAHWWDGWGSNSRPADYEKCGPALRMR